MLPMASILFVGICVAIILIANLGKKLRQQMVAMRAQVDEEVEVITKDTVELDVDLVSRLASGRPIEESLTEWQRKRAELFQGTRLSQPHAWTERDLKSWRREQLQRRGEEIHHRALFASLVGVAVLLLVFGGATILAYRHYAGSQPSESPRLPAAIAPSFTPGSPEAWLPSVPGTSNTDTTDGLRQEKSP